MRKDQYQQDFDGNPKYINITNATDVFYLNKSYIQMHQNELSLQNYYHLDFDNHVLVMGEYITEDFEKMKAYTKLEVKLDIYEVYREAHHRVEEDLLK